MGASTHQLGQRVARGRALMCLGWTLRVLGLGMAYSGAVLGESLLTDPTDGVARLPLWLRLLILLAVVAVGGLVMACGSPVLVRGKQHRARIVTSFGQLAGERYVLYLRPFALDPAMASPPSEAPGRLFRSPFELPGLTHEEFLIQQVAPIGRVVAIGQPGERLPLLGAERGYLPVDNWQDTVSELIRGAHVVMMSAAPGPGTVWEFTEALRTIAPTRLLLLVYCAPADYDAFRVAVSRRYAARSGQEVAGGPAAMWPPLPRLPDLPAPRSHPKKPRWDFPLRGLISFDQDWHASFTRFDLIVPRVRWYLTVRRLVRRELEPVLTPLSQLPPAQPSA